MARSLRGYAVTAQNEPGPAHPKAEAMKLVGYLWIEYELSQKFARARIPIYLTRREELHKNKPKNPHLFLTPTLAIFKRSTFSPTTICMKTLKPNLKLTRSQVNRALQFMVENARKPLKARVKAKPRLIRYYIEN